MNSLRTKLTGNTVHSAGRERNPRICLPTFRNFARTPFRCSHYEAQDVLAEVDTVDLICLEAEARLPKFEKWLRKISFHDVTRRLMFLNPGLRTVRLSQDYDLFVAVCQNYFDILYFNAIDGWRDRCRTGVCWLEEMWASSVPGYKHWLHALSRFDHIFVGCLGSVQVMSEALGRPVHWLPSAVDTIRFSPFPSPPARVIDVYSIGRRWEGSHRALHEAAQRGDIFYVHDTFAAADAETHNPQEHRQLFANMAKRSCYFMVAPAKMNNPVHTNHQVEIGSRYYEGAAAGTVMIGQAPDLDLFRQMFPWTDAVVHIEPDGTDVLNVLGRLASDPSWLATVRAKNTSGALMRHDWLHRWQQMFHVMGFPESTGMSLRQRRLQELASLVTDRTENVAPAGMVK